MLRFLLLTGLYLLGIWYAVAFIRTPDEVTLFWPPAGIAFAAVLRYGWRWSVFIPVAVLVAHLASCRCRRNSSPSRSWRISSARSPAPTRAPLRRATAHQRGQRLRNAAREHGDGAGVRPDRHHRPGVLGHGAGQRLVGIAAHLGHGRPARHHHGGADAAAGERALLRQSRPATPLGLLEAKEKDCGWC
jgi:hypothetical protein